MKFIPIFKELLNCSNSSDVLEYFQNNLTDSIMNWNYFVNWVKVNKNFHDVELYLNLINYLIGKEDLEKELHDLLKRFPEVIIVIPILLACRTNNFKILIDYTQGDLNYENFNFTYKINPDERDIEAVVKFAKNTGILNLFEGKKLKSIPDYVFGIEVGLDSNGRKNRGGDIMETIVKNILQNTCKESGFLLMKQATSLQLQRDWNVLLKEDKANRKFDFAVKTKDILYLIETNFYGGGGSKLKATAGEYKGLFDVLSSQGHKFIWITDGFGWKSALRPLEETFNHIDYTLNLKMLSTGLLDRILIQQL